MKKSGIAVAFVLVVLALAVLAVPAHAPRPTASLAFSSTGVAGSAPGTLRTAVAPATPTPQTTFPRTVLIETFTGVWCPHCPAETQSLYQFDLNTSHSVLNIAELHVCGQAPPAACLDNYVPPDQTSYTRGTFYSVCGYPDVFFDGQHDVCGASNSESQMGGEYAQHIANASAYAGNVSIADVASVSLGNVSDFVNVTSGVTGTYNAVTYLLEYIGKLNVNNGGGPHDIGNVVRETLYNHPLNLTAGEKTSFHAIGPVNSSWNTQNLSVATLVQANATHIVQNANMSAVSNMVTTVTSNASIVVSGNTATITVHAINGSSGLAIPGATVTVSPSLGSVNPTSGVTGSGGTFTTTFTASNVSAPQPVLISAQVQASGFVDGTGAVSIVVNPLVLSPAPTGLTVMPGNGEVTLNWTTPAAGGFGDTYYVYRSTSASGGYGPIGTSTTNQYVDSSVLTGQSYWYTVSAQNTSGFSGNTTATGATGVTTVPQGLPSTIAWWFSIDSQNFTSTGASSLPLFLPTGNFTYQFAPRSYAYVGEPVTAMLHVAGTPITLTAAFVPRYASLEGTVSPANAAVTLNGTVVNLTGGAFVEALAAGSYVIDVTAPGYQSNSTTVVLTPGNLTTDNV
ncbi:MAG: hypothetical protein L3K17_09440, partial [Thermoplasmata archaeon]|nr:hypothetical protein [Thermoplasmata archaeon]